MAKYHLMEMLGHGAFGCVWKALNIQSCEIVAVKILHRNEESSCCEKYLVAKEARCLRALQHPNIVQLREVCKIGDHLHLVFEYMESDLHNIIRRRINPCLETNVRRLSFQLLKGLSYMHRRGYCHRDLKPENLLLTKDVLKIADLGVSVNIWRCREKGERLHSYVVTRWYRAPELLLQASSYDFAIDMWSVGAIMAELFTLTPLFPGSNEEDQIYKICSVIGSPDAQTWSEGIRLASSLGYQFPPVFYGLDGLRNLRMLMPSASDEAIDLIMSLCSWDPKRRPTSQQALRHPFFKKCYINAKGSGYHVKGDGKSSVGYTKRTKILPVWRP